MEREKVTIYFLLILIAVFSYMIATLVYKESFRSQKQVRILELSLTNNE